MLLVCVFEAKFLALLSLPTQTALFLAIHNMKCFSCIPGKGKEKIVL